MVYTASHGTAEIFVNGSSVGKSADFVMPTSIANTDALFMIGMREGAISNYAGKIDEVHIWRRALLSAQVAQLYLHSKNLTILQNCKAVGNSMEI
jgi:Concanavalin A-like lectin/glucanases superfamily